MAFDKGLVCPHYRLKELFLLVASIQIAILARIINRTMLHEITLDIRHIVFNVLEYLANSVVGHRIKAAVMKRLVYKHN